MNQNSTSKPTAKSGGRKLRNDLIFIMSLLAVVVLAGLAVFFLGREGDTVIIEIDGKTFGSYPLSENRTVEIRTGEGGEELNLLVIKDGQAFVETASCPDGICSAHKPISREGESIVCLPHRVVITVRTTDREDAPDVVA